MAEQPPRITVLMSVHNDERYVGSAVESILGQTYAAFEFVIIDDGSTDDSLRVLRSFDDRRIRLVSRENRGLTASLNEGIGLARGEFIARQDSDDISLPTRLERELAVLAAEPRIGLVGTNYTIIDESDRPLETTSVFTHPDDLAIAEILSNQFGHGSVMLRRSVVERVGGYDAEVGHVEDYDLFVRISHVAEIANIAEPLYLWRRTSDGISVSNTERQIALAFAVRDREFRRVLENRRGFKLLSSFHPLGFRPSVRAYLEKKSALFRDLAYLYRLHGRAGAAILMQLVAAAHAPWQRRNLLNLALLLRDHSRRPLWDYEFL